MPTLEQRLAALEAEQAIRRLLVEFVAGCDAGYDADRIASLFCMDAVMELGPLGRYDGRDAIHGFFQRIASRIPSTGHFQMNVAVRVDEDGRGASGRWYGLETPTVDDQALWGAFTYTDRYRRDEDDRWRIERLHQRFEFLTPYDQGWARTPAVEL